MAQNGKKWYSIGEMSELMGISPQTLRHYCNIGLIAPEFIDPDSGYRYFSFRQFHYIDRARYLLACGFHLKEIKEILDSNDVDYTNAVKYEILRLASGIYPIDDTLNKLKQKLDEKNKGGGLSAFFSNLFGKKKKKEEPEKKEEKKEEVPEE